MCGLYIMISVDKYSVWRPEEAPLPPEGEFVETLSGFEVRENT